MLMCSSCVKMASLVLLFKNRLRASSHVCHTLLYVLHELVECQFRLLEMLVQRIWCKDISTGVLLHLTEYCMFVHILSSF